MHNYAEPLFAGFALKLILNAISTGANIMKGKVFRNTMINLTVANDKVPQTISSYLATQYVLVSEAETI